MNFLHIFREARTKAAKKYHSEVDAHVAAPCNDFIAGAEWAYKWLDKKEEARMTKEIAKNKTYSSI